MLVEMYVAPEIRIPELAGLDSATTFNPLMPLSARLSSGSSPKMCMTTLVDQSIS